jgi:hypothetical protein
LSEPAPDPAARERPDRPADARHLLGSFVGMTGMAIVLYVVLASGVFAPVWAIALMTLVWLVMFVVATRWFITHPWRVAALPVVTLGLWIGAVFAGAAFLDWNA